MTSNQPPAGRESAAPPSGVGPVRGAESLGEIVDRIGVTRTHYVALVLVVLGGLFEVFEQLILSSLGPALQEAFGIDSALVSVLSSVTLLAVVAGGIVGGILGDRFGRRAVLSVSLAIYCAGTVISAFSPSYEVLAFSRVVTGLGVGGEIAIGLTYLSELSPTKVRGVFVSLFNTVSAGVGTFLVFAYTLLVLGPVATAVGAGPDAWRWAFGLLGIPVVLIVFFRRYLPETPAHLLKTGDLDGANVALTRLARGRLRLRPDDEVTTYVDERTAAASESAQAAGSTRQELASVVGRALRGRTVVMSLAAFLAWGVQFSVIIIMPILLVQRGYSVAGSLALTMVQNLGALIGACVATFASYAVARRFVVAVGTVAGAVSVVAFALLAYSDLTILLIGFVFQVFCLMVNTTLWLWAPELYPTHVRAFGTSLIVNIGFLGGAVIPVLVTVVFEWAGVVPAFALLAVMYVVMALLMTRATETRGVSLERLHGDAPAAA
ncbi:MFS transporter [Pseudonocardia endophytica]|uniref:Putative MFS transporter n=1 Tax=Pseudonocardia endophytica TaxID=401976 RepID=A0A4R1I629_PSEEN|nr:MFS transporter [Pseudonocardia endophytica]TCK25542.1 putative MFS transporter [Pseudonocardia endophytica]